MEFLKSGAASFDEAAQISMRINGSIWCDTHEYHDSTTSSVNPTPMEIFNVEVRPPMDPQRLEDYRNNAWTKFHNTGFRPWNQRKCAGRNKKGGFVANNSRGKSGANGNSEIDTIDDGDQSENSIVLRKQIKCLQEDVCDEFQ